MRRGRLLRRILVSVKREARNRDGRGSCWPLVENVIKLSTVYAHRKAEEGGGHGAVLPHHDAHLFAFNVIATGDLPSSSAPVGAPRHDGATASLRRARGI